MTIFLTFYLVVFLGFWSKPKRHKSKGTVRCVCLLWCFDSNLEYHLNIEVWNSFLILSCLSVFFTTVDANSNLIELQGMLKKMEPVFEKYDALVYAPVPDIRNCTPALMYCYLLELYVIITEQNDPAYENFTQMVYVNQKQCEKCIDKGCRQCETHPVANSTVFSQRMVEFIQKLLSSGAQGCGK